MAAMVYTKLSIKKKTK